MKLELDSRVITNIVREVPFFHGLSVEQAQNLVKAGEQVNLKTDDVLIREGQPGEEMYVLFSGSTRVIRSGSDAVLAKVTPIGIIGEIALLLRQPRTATVIADEPSMVLRFSRSVLNEIFSKDIKLQVLLFHNLCNILCAKLIKNNIKIEEYSLQSRAQGLKVPPPVVYDASADVAHQTLVKIIKDVRFFRGLTFHQVEKFIAGCERVSVDGGEVLMKEGTSGQEMYLLLSGAVKVASHDGSVSLAKIIPIRVIGEVAMMLIQTRTATVTAEEFSQLFKITRAQLLKLFAADLSMELQIYHNLCNILCEKLLVNSIVIEEYSSCKRALNH